MLSLQQTNQWHGVICESKYFVFVVYQLRVALRDSHGLISLDLWFNLASYISRIASLSSALVRTLGQNGEVVQLSH